LNRAGFLKSIARQDGYAKSLQGFHRHARQVIFSQVRPGWMLSELGAIVRWHGFGSHPLIRGIVNRTDGSEVEGKENDVHAAEPRKTRTKDADRTKSAVDCKK